MGARAWPGAFALVPKGCGTRCAQTKKPGRSRARRRLEVAPWDGAGMKGKGIDQRHWILDWIPDQSLSSTFVIGDRGQRRG